MYDVSSEKVQYSGPDVLAVILLGIIGGIFGSLYNYLVDKVLRTYSIINEKGAAFKISLVIAIALLTSCCSYGLPWFGRCIPCPTHITLELAMAVLLGDYLDPSLTLTPVYLPYLELHPSLVVP